MAQHRVVGAEGSEAELVVIGTFGVALERRGAEGVGVGVAKAAEDAGAVGEVVVEADIELVGAHGVDDGTELCWRRDAKELFFLSADRILMSVQIAGSSRGFDASIPRPLFPTRRGQWYAPAGDVDAFWSR